ncbi:MAG: DNA polymerase III subunit delta' [Deltaproteobacteria bacterium]|nr:DNA polymerase III subunit delta' [Deltaproteobacteria bacterium]
MSAGTDTSPLLSRVRAQGAARRTIEHALEKDRVHHAYLFAGPDGVGKELAAFGLAQALVCEKRGDTGQGGLFGAASAPSHLACGACSACLRAVPRDDERRPVHPDIVVLERGLYAPQAIGRRTPETQDISIDQVRTLVLARAAYAPHEGRAKVFVIRRAEELSVSAANALLKTLEEPGPRTHFVLLTSQPDALLPTILSRTMRVRFAPLPSDVVIELLVARGIDAERAREVARLAGGSVEAGELLADPESSEARDRFVERAFTAISAPTLEPLLALAEDAKKEKDELRGRIAALAAAIAERAASADPRESAAMAARGRFALAALEHLDGNNAPQLVVEGMLSRMRAI